MLLLGLNCYKEHLQPTGSKSIGHSISSFEVEFCLEPAIVLKIEQGISHLVRTQNFPKN